MKTLLVLCLSLTTIALFAQAKSGIEYSENAAFHWGLFKGKINPRHIAEMGTNTGAVTVSSLSYQTLEVTSRYAKIRIISQFHPHESWTRYPKMNNADEALIHEKRHFDICEIYARKIRQAVSTTKFKRETFNDELNFLFKKLSAEHRDLQAKYDLETDHCINAEEQALWNAAIDSKLEELSKYSSPVVTVGLY